MQKAKVADGGSADGLFLDRDGLTSGTLFKAKYPNDNFGNLFDLVINAGYTLIDDDLSQITKAVRGGYNPTYTYNTESIASQSVNDIVLGSDGNYYECIVNATTGDDPVGSVTGNWRIIPNFELLMNTATINFATNADITLTTAQNQYGRFVITDTGALLTTTRNIIVSTTQKRFLVQNSTTKSLVVKTSAGTGITVLAGEKADLYCDGTNIVDSFFTYKNPAFSAFLGADLVLSAATFTKVPFVDTYGYDATGNFDNTNFRFQPNKAGIYHVSGGIRFNTSDTTQIIVYKNGAAYRYLHYGSSTANLFNGNSIDVFLNGTSDYIELYVRSNNANTVLNAGGNAGESSATFFQAHFAGAL